MNRTSNSISAIGNESAAESPGVDPAPSLREIEEYKWNSAEASHAASYLLPVVLRRLVGIHDSALLLDAGCGNGATLGALQSRGYRLHGLEISESGLEQARGAHPKIEFQSADLTADLCANVLWGTVDVVISLEVVEHVFLPRAYARNLFGLLRPGGRAIISTPYHGYVKNLVLAATGKLDAHFTALWDYGHIKFWSRATLESLFNEAGFRVIGFDGAGRAPYLWKSMIMTLEKPN